MEALVVSIINPARNGRTRRAVEALSHGGWAVDLCSPVPSDKLNYRKCYELGGSFGSLKLRIPWTIRRVLFRFFLFLSYFLGAKQLVREASRWAQLFLDAEVLGDALSNSYKLIIVEDFHLLGFVLQNRARSKVVFDSRDYYHRLYENRWWWQSTYGKAFSSFAQLAYPECDRIITVSTGLSREFQNEFGVTASVVRSIPDIEPIPHKTRESGPIRVIYHGRSDSSRSLIEIAQAIDACNNEIFLDLFLTGNKASTRLFEFRTRKMPRVRVRKPVGFLDLVPLSSSYDLGLVVLKPVTINLDSALPNKFFEYLFAGIPVLAGPTRELAETLERYQCGVVLEDLGKVSLVDFFGSLTEPKISGWSRNIASFVKDHRWPSERSALMNLCRDLVSERD